MAFGFANLASCFKSQQVNKLKSGKDSQKENSNLHPFLDTDLPLSTRAFKWSIYRL